MPGPDRGALPVEAEVTGVGQQKPSAQMWAEGQSQLVWQVELAMHTSVIHVETHPRRVQVSPREQRLPRQAPPRTTRRAAASGAD